MQLSNWVEQQWNWQLLFSLQHRICVGCWSLSRFDLILILILILNICLLVSFSHSLTHPFVDFDV